MEQFAEDLWIADGPVVRFFGAPYPTRMAAIRLADGSLWINSPVISTPEMAANVERVGPVAHLVSPTRLHDWRLEECAKFFPSAQIWKAGTLGDSSPEAWKDQIDQMVFRGSFALEEIEFFHRRSGTLIVGDFLQNFQPDPHKPLFNAFLRFGGIMQGGAPRDLRLSFLGNSRRRMGREALHKMLSWNFDKLVVAHGDCVRTKARPFVERSFSWLVG